jgi:outer membrane protein OmpA-like peptidoglycan-associated protein
MFTRSNKNKVLFLVIAVAVMAVLISAGTVTAGGGWHGGGHWHGGWGWGWPYYGLGFATGAFLSYPYSYYPYYPYYSYYPYYPYAYAQTYSPSPRVIVRERKPAMDTWYYYCRKSNAYYPYVRRCPGGWEKVPIVPRPSLPQPSLPQPAASVIDKMTLRVNFDVDKAIIRLSDKAALYKAVAFVKKYPQAKIELDGYTDNTGTEAHNLQLSEKRAQAVKQYLVKEAGIDQSQISAFGRGESNPVADNKTAEGRFQNRRVEILILGK